ncbi:MAG: glycine dehydrogenase, partial [Oligoflexia bacterium]|nr:glycine dehydrogenase [Oligoflexia bacterium]
MYHNNSNNPQRNPKSKNGLPFDPYKLKRELAPHYIPATDNEIENMLKALGMKRLDDLYAHLSDVHASDEQYTRSPFLSPIEYFQLPEHLQNIASKNKIKTSFIGDGLKHYRTPEIVPIVSNIRGLTTPYTPYQPERSQGTLQGLWIYTSLISALTGFEAINASLYDRATALFEALNTAKKIKANKAKSDSDPVHVLICDSIYPGDKEVLITLAAGTNLHLHFLPLDTQGGVVSPRSAENMITELSANGEQLVAIAFPAVNSLGNLEDVDAFTDLAQKINAISIAIIDPMLISNGGLKPPAIYGSNQQGANIFVGEGQHLALPPSFGGPGLGIFGIRYNEKNRSDIRSTPGRYVGLAKDSQGRPCKTL